jgi:phage terminase small subunit
MGRPRKPSNLKAISGTTQPCRIVPDDVQFEKIDYLPKAPDWLPNVHAVKEWDKLVRILHSSGVLTEACLSPLEMMCALRGKMVQLYHAGEAPSASLHNSLQAMQASFGLPPAAYGKIKPSNGDNDNDNPFSKHKKPPKK